LRIKKGFSLIEVFFALTIMGMICVLVCGVFVHGIDALKKSRYRVVAINIADKKFSELRYLLSSTYLNTISATDLQSSIEGTDTVSAGFNWTPPCSVTISGKETVDRKVYSFTINVKDYTGINDLKKVDISISWGEAGTTHHVDISSYIAKSRED